MMSHIGSPGYMDNRVLQGKPYDISVDIYALGMIFLSVFKGSGIFDQCGKAEMDRKRSEISSHFEESMEEILDGVPESMKGVIKNCLQEDHERRYQADEVSSISPSSSRTIPQRFHDCSQQ